MIIKNYEERVRALDGADTIRAAAKQLGISASYMAAWSRKHYPDHVKRFTRRAVQLRYNYRHAHNFLDEAMLELQRLVVLLAMHHVARRRLESALHFIASARELMCEKPIETQDDAPATPDPTSPNLARD